MMENTKHPASVAIIGGDGRMVHTARAFSADGCSVMLWGQNGERERSERINADLVILPIPLTRDGKHLNAPYVEPLTLDELVAMLRPGQTVAAGNADARFAEAVRGKGCDFFDYGRSDAYAIPNALATAEGAIAMAITHSDALLAGASAAILGFGRIGKQLCRLLIALGVKVTVYARREADLAYAVTMGAVGLSVEKIRETLGKNTMIFNTIPVKLLKSSDFDCLRPDALFFDLAPVYEGGEDERIIRCPALPYRYSPKSAGELIHACLCGYLDREGGRA